MPKSKQQKQKEAIERNRKGFEGMRLNYLDYQMGGKYYERAKATNRLEHAISEATFQRVRFEKWCAANKLDTHGNDI